MNLDHQGEERKTEIKNDSTSVSEEQIMLITGLTCGL